MAKFRFDNIYGHESEAVDMLENILSMKRHPTCDEQAKVSMLIGQLYKIMPNWSLKLILLDHGWETYYGEMVRDEDGQIKWFKEVMGRHGFDDEAFYEEI